MTLLFGENMSEDASDSMMDDLLDKEQMDDLPVSEFPKHQCSSCQRTFRLAWTGPSPLHYANTRYCPRCGERL